MCVKYGYGQLASVDQTPLPFSFTEGEMYSDKGEKTVWV